MNNMMKNTLLGCFVIGALAALGKVFFWGESVTNYGAYTPWGLWVGLYILLVGTAAGAAWVGIYTTWSGRGINRLTMLSLLTAGLSLSFGLAFIGLDLGKPLKGISIFLHPSFSSKLAWASWLYTCFFGCLAGYFLTNAKKTFLYLCGLLAFAFLMAEGLFFGTMVSRQLWYSWLTPLSFITSALTAGVALVTVVSTVVDKTLLLEEGTRLPQVLLYSLIAHVGVELVHLVTGLGSAKGDLVRSLWMAWPFWGLFLLVGVALPAVLLFKGYNRQSILPAAFILLGLAAYKYSFIRYGFSNEPLSGLADAFQHSRLTLSYAPALVEWVVAAGLIAGLLWSVGVILPKLLARIEA
ncbi:MULTISPECIES: NrfD/PsrC family molybdoenzyme membrane anchor subunit [Sporomusa]|uniref:NrfD/PsrC family molybdoenzyme membrane anchor subunit n=1 Tax=Sporomusa TaxID=2375 RepID=UPI00166C544D|nr:MULTISPECIES: NrfD/PsrC family molybdoenzyme membrane anchor subunit [Sporomusa]HML35649.1 polysulfide reductase NrfD [Sporomusa sphaeroides]